MKSKRVVLIFSTIIFIFFNFYLFPFNPAKNFKTAYIEKSENKYIITVKGKRNLMVHDPISILKKGTYIDSAKFIIPRDQGIIKGNELPQEKDSYQYLNNNAILINQNSLKINLFYYNYDDKENRAETWNGNYKLIKRNY